MDNINNAIIKIDKALNILYNIKIRQEEELNIDQIIKQTRYTTDKQLENIFNKIENKFIK
jgi:hypothetical protein